MEDHDAAMKKLEQLAKPYVCLRGLPINEGSKVASLMASGVATLCAEMEKSQKFIQYDELETGSSFHG